TGYWSGWDIARGIVLNPRTASAPATGYVLDGWGGIHPFSSGLMPSTPTDNAYWSGWDIARGIVLSGTGMGYTLDGYGGVHPFGGTAAATTSAYWGGWDIARGLTFFSGSGGGEVLD